MTDTWAPASPASTQGAPERLLDAAGVDALLAADPDVGAARRLVDLVLDDVTRAAEHGAERERVDPSARRGR